VWNTKATSLNIMQCTTHMIYMSRLICVEHKGHSTEHNAVYNTHDLNIEIDMCGIQRPQH